METVTEGERQCRVAPQHPCDPAGPINTCPKGPRYDCSSPHGPTTRTLFVQRFRDGRPTVEAVDLDLDPERVLDIAVDGDALSVLLVDAQRRSGWGLYRVQLGAGETSPRPVRWPREAHASDFAVDTLLDAGFTIGRGSSPDVGAAQFTDTTLETGGNTLGAGWVDLTLPDAAGATLQVQAEVAEWHDGCGQPELTVVWGTRRWSLLLAADPPRLHVDQGPAIHLEGAAHGDHTWTLSVAEQGVTVSIDGTEVHRSALGVRPSGPTWATTGQRMSCGRPVGPAVVWKSVSVDGAESANNPDPPNR